MIENDLHTQESNVQREQPSSIATGLNAVIVRLLNIVYLLFDTLHFLLVPGEMLRQIEEEFDQQIYRRDDG